MGMVRLHKKILEVLEQMKLVVTGGRGFIGSHFVEEALGVRPHSI